MVNVHGLNLTGASPDSRNQSLTHSRAEDGKVVRDDDDNITFCCTDRRRQIWTLTSYLLGSSMAPLFFIIVLFL